MITSDESGDERRRLARVPETPAETKEHPLTRTDEDDPRPRNRARLLAIAYRMLGSQHDADDAVQEGFLRWERLTAHGRAEVDNPDAWLTTVVGRICLDHLGAARVRREQYAGVWLPEPIPGRTEALHRLAPNDPADVCTFEESVSMAMLVVMERMSPAERVCFVLHDVFGVPFGEIATAVGRSPDACRALASAARRHLRSERRYEAEGPERSSVVDAFRNACTSGNLKDLINVLDPQVVMRSDGGGRLTAALRPIIGAEPVSRYLDGILNAARPAPTWRDRYGEAPVSIESAFINDQAGLVVKLGGITAVVVALAVAGGKVARVDLVVNPDKLRAWN